MKITISQLQQFIQEAFEDELEEAKEKQQKGKKRAKKVAKRKKKKGERHFSPSQTPAEADETFKQCMELAEVEPEPGVDLETAKARVCTDQRKESGATLDWSKKREKEVQRARKGGKSGYEKSK